MVMEFWLVERAFAMAENFSLCYLIYRPTHLLASYTRRQTHTPSGPVATGAEEKERNADNDENRQTTPLEPINAWKEMKRRKRGSFVCVCVCGTLITRHNQTPTTYPVWPILSFVLSNWPNDWLIGGSKTLCVDGEKWVSEKVNFF